MITVATMGEVRFVSRSRELRFQRPVDVVCTAHWAEVMPLLERVSAAVDQGLHAAGFITFDAAPAFDRALVARQTPEFPLAWFGLYRDKEEVAPCVDEGEDHELGSLQPLITREEYLGAVGRIREYIAAGDTYQVNYTFPLRGSFRGNPLHWFYSLCRAQCADYCAFVHMGSHVIVSASPELFFHIEGERIETRPMKGTRPRGLWPAEDKRLACELASSAKDRAENIMIVDLLRNDLARISPAGAVEVPRLFDVERYPTVWQMTSTVASRTRAEVPNIFAALFPCGSVTGAPKVRTMEIIRELEPFPRGIYCGAIGWWSPGRRAEFNVAIRTAVLDAHDGVVHYGVGSGLTWDSNPEGEYEECLVKAAMLTRRTAGYELLESILFDGEYFLLREHLERLAASADYFGFACDVRAIHSALAQETLDWKIGSEPVVPRKVRLLLARDGTFRIGSEPAPAAVPIRVGFAVGPVDPTDVFLYHKTTFRDIYARAKASRPDCDDVILWNTRGEVTEGSNANIVLDVGGVLLTPPVSSGLLPGTMRTHLLASGHIREAVLTKSDVRKARAVWFINSVRKWVEAVIC